MGDIAFSYRGLSLIFLLSVWEFQINTGMAHVFLKLYNEVLPYYLILLFIYVILIMLQRSEQTKADCVSSQQWVATPLLPVDPRNSL